MNGKQCKELRAAFIVKFPQYKDYKKLKMSTPQEREVYAQFKNSYQKAKKQFNKTPSNEKIVVTIH